MLAGLDGAGWIVFAIVWLFASFGCGALLARFYKRLHPTFSFHRLWAFWTVVVSVAAVVILALI